jgi:hypothetical protein
MSPRQNLPALDDNPDSPDSKTPLYVRGELRRKVNRKPDGSFIVESRGLRAEVLEVIDVSRAGIRLKIDRALEVPAPVVLHYKTAAMSMQLNGAICWQALADEVAGLNRLIGIELIGPSLLVDQL